jgi:6,7-dimethyl-8-ribityllumazine synthase
VTARFHGTVTERLLEGAQACLRGHGIPEDAIVVIRVAGAFEVPQAAAVLARGHGTSRPVGIVALAAVVKGETPHFDYICAEVSRGLMTIGLETGVPVGFGVLTCTTLAEALARAGGDSGNKGWDAAEAAWQLGDALRRERQGLEAPGGESGCVSDGPR